MMESGDGVCIGKQRMFVMADNADRALEPGGSRGTYIDSSWAAHV